MIEHNLTEKECAIIHLLLNGKSNGEIAKNMEISINTVKFHLQNIYRKLGTNNRTSTSVKLLKEEIFRDYPFG